MVTVLLFIDIQRCRSGLKLLGSGRTCDGVRNQNDNICFFTTKFHILFDSQHCPIFFVACSVFNGDVSPLVYEDMYTNNFHINDQFIRYCFLDCHTYILLKVLHFSNNCKKMSFGTKDIIQCWENYVGFAFYRLIIVDFAFLLLSTFFGEFVRRCELLLIL